MHQNTTFENFLEGLVSLVASGEQSRVGGDGGQRERFPLYFFFWILSQGIALFKEQIQLQFAKKETLHWDFQHRPALSGLSKSQMLPVPSAEVGRA